MEQSGKVKIACRNVGKAFPTKTGEFQVLKNLSFDVKENEFLVFSGRGNAGKQHFFICWPDWRPVRKEKSYITEIR